MNEKYKKEFTHILNAILAALSKKATANVKALAAQFYVKLPLIDMQTLKPEEAAQVVQEAYDFLQERIPGTPKIRISHKKSRTVIEILNDDMAFLVDSVTAEINRQGLTIIDISHPIIRLARGKKHELTTIAPLDDFGVSYTAESFIRIETSRLPETVSEEKLKQDILTVLSNVRFTVGDFKAMRAKVDATIAELAQAPSYFKQEEVDEIKDFLRWIADNNLVFLGYIEYNFTGTENNQKLDIVPESELGVFKGDDGELKPKGLIGLPPEVLHFVLVPQLVEITKSMRKSTVHRPVHMDYIGIKRFDLTGKVIGERRFLGLFTSTVYYQSASTIPFIRRKIARVLARAGYDPVSHDGKLLKAIIEFTPRDELFQFSEDDLFDYAMGVLSLESRPTVRLFVRRDAFERSVSCIVFLHRERFSTELREEVMNILARAFSGTVSAFYTQMTDSPLVRVYLIIATIPGKILTPNVAELEKQIAQAAYRWSDALLAALTQELGEDAAEAQLRIYGKAFTKGYMAVHSPEATIRDIHKINEVIQSAKATFDLFRNDSDPENIVHLKWYNPESQIPLSDVLPILENMGFKVVDENPYPVMPAHSSMKEVWIRDLTLFTNPASIATLAIVKPLLEETLSKISAGDMENDALAGLVLNAHFTWREVVLIRAYVKYLRQINFSSGLDAIAATLNGYPAIARLLLAVFITRFDPKKHGDTTAHITAIDTELQSVSNLTEDRILRRLLELILATLRTNYFQMGAEGEAKSYVSFKLDSAKVPELPLPRPYAEIFVYSARFEGIHLRGGKVARGGLRWSDRRDDFRTEVLGLMKAQMVKNAVIVPVGSKGGFILKRPTPTREALMEEGIACYKIFLAGLLDLTDNIVQGNVVPPQHVVRLDGDDPYLVVAADKGTATFSDYANAVSADYGFWLGDAFASGGSVGYDHKKMAITARGAFISVARHFREMNVDIYAQDFSVVGIGDMAGDVFGNGMLLSPHIRLVAAFNHQHIFIDPTPDTEASFAERERLFHLPRSSWKDYNPERISSGGGVFDRSAKSIPISKELKSIIHTDKPALSPDELIRALLLAPVDLLWNGGIGTYVKAQDETHEQVGDRANNTLRVNGNELRCKVVGEGGNLGFTQKGRVEYARAGGRINTDAIDNSAGVDCSDHEVNIKVGLGASMAAGKLTRAERDTILAGMTEDVAQLVLKDNQLQTQALSLAELKSRDMLGDHQRLIHYFERRGELNREVEYLPTDKELAERKSAGGGLTRPELAVLLAYSKMNLYTDILASDLPDDAYFTKDLLLYFPPQLARDFASALEAHPLKREIIATSITNDLINHTGITFIYRLAEETETPLYQVARAAVTVRELFGLRNLWQQIEALDGKVAVSLQVELFVRTQLFVEQATRWFLGNVISTAKVETLLGEFEAGIKEYEKSYTDIVSQVMEQTAEEQKAALVAAGAPETIARSIAHTSILVFASDIVRIAHSEKKPVTHVGAVYFKLATLLMLDGLREQLRGLLKGQSYWERVAIQSVLASLELLQHRLTIAVLKKKDIAEWVADHQEVIDRYKHFSTEIRNSGTMSFAKLVIIVKKLEELSINQ